MTSDGHLLRMDLLVQERWNTRSWPTKRPARCHEHVEQVHNYLACLNRDQENEQKCLPGGFWYTLTSSVFAL